jgi:hypothetical protein
MRPPDCFVCHLTLSDVPDEGSTRDYFTLVHFGKWIPPRDADGPNYRTGHPRDSVWFCNDHLPLALDYKDRGIDEGPAAIKTDPRYRAR